MQEKPRGGGQEVHVGGIGRQDGGHQAPGIILEPLAVMAAGGCRL